MILNPNIFPNLNSNLLDLKKPQEQVEKAFCYRTMNIVLNFHCSNKLFYWFQPSASNFKSLSQSLEQLFLIVGQNNFVNKIPCLSRRERFQKENQYTGTPSTIVCRRWRSWLPEIEWKEKKPPSLQKCWSHFFYWLWALWSIPFFPQASMKMTEHSELSF